MKFYIFKINNKRMLVVLLSTLVLFLIALEFVSACALSGVVNAEDNASRIDFIKNLGLEPQEEVIEVKQTVIPQIFGEVYLRYNDLQKEAGYNLLDYKGETVTVFRYKVSKFNDQEVFVNLIVYNGEVIGGDISSVSLDGFMLPLKELE